ncbi:MAG TPA: hypothetical protein VF595_16635 [Tepidisphaeraceae bacterium]|jgi:hypothetical protein
MLRYGLILSCLAAGCTAGRAPSPPPAVLLGPQLRQQDEQLIGQKFRTLLDFENSADTAFVNTSAGDAAGHTGARAVRCGRVAAVDVDSILFGLSLPGDYTLLGGYVKPAAARVTTTLVVDGRPVGDTTRDVPPGVWAFVAIDLTDENVVRHLRNAKSIELRFNSPDGFDLDDVLLVDNRRTLAEGANGWAVRQAGLSLDVRVPGVGPVQIETVAAGRGGWVVEEVSAVRLRVRDVPAERYWTLLASGQSILNGKPFKPATVAEVTPDAATARPDRETPGDTDNDGYNERRGAYAIVARGPRVRLSIDPGRQPADSPVFEVKGLPPGPAAVTAGGRLVEATARLADGTLLVMVPMVIDRPTEITVAVAGE